MADYGLRIKHPTTGAVLLEYTDRITRVLGSFNTAKVNGSFTVPASGLVWFAVMNPGQYGGLTGPPTVYLSGSVITWEFRAIQQSTDRIAVDILYGLY